MASKRLLKKRVQRIVIDILDECDFVLQNGGKSAEIADKLMDEAVDFHDSILTKINQAKDKKDFKEILETLNKADEDFLDRLNKLNH